MNSRRYIASLLCALLLAYPLSMGPVARIQTLRHPGEGTPHWFFILYYPVLKAAEPFPTVGEIIQGYVELWIVKSDRR